jgi:dolichyl-phosphate beta-glucosyltransferase
MRHAPRSSGQSHSNVIEEPRISVAIVVPAFNEAARLGVSLQQLTEFLSRQPWDWEVRVVDDGSIDDTSGVVEACARQDSRIVLQREPHRGKGGAVKAGLTGSKAHFRFICDADLSMPVTELPRFLPPTLGSFDVAIGTREGPGARRVGEPLRRHLAGRVFNFIVQRLTLPGIKDTQCGFKMFTARAVEAIFPYVEEQGWAFDIEVLCIARAKGLPIVEVPIEWHYRRDSQLDLVRDGARMFRQLLEIRARVRKGAYVVGAK